MTVLTPGEQLAEVKLRISSFDALLLPLTNRLLDDISIREERNDSPEQILSWLSARILDLIGAISLRFAERRDGRLRQLEELRTLIPPELSPSAVGMHELSSADHAYLALGLVANRFEEWRVQALPAADCVAAGASLVDLVCPGWYWMRLRRPLFRPDIPYRMYHLLSDIAEQQGLDDPIDLTGDRPGYIGYTHNWCSLHGIQPTGETEEDRAQSVEALSLLWLATARSRRWAHIRRLLRTSLRGS